jgi:hypothetical protein
MKRHAIAAVLALLTLDGTALAQVPLDVGSTTQCWDAGSWELKAIGIQSYRGNASAPFER